MLYQRTTSDPTKGVIIRCAPLTSVRLNHASGQCEPDSSCTARASLAIDWV